MTLEGIESAAKEHLEEIGFTNGRVMTGTESMADIMARFTAKIINDDLESGKIKL